MNPETKVTVDQLKKICAQHSLVYVSHRRVTTGFTHEVHRINDDMIIKIYNSVDPKGYETERRLLAIHSDFPKPQLIASSDDGTVIDRSYVIMTYVEGFSLGSKWHEATDVQRQQLVKEISRALKEINSLVPESIALDAAESWYETTSRRGKALSDELRHSGVISLGLATQVCRAIERNKQSLRNSPLYPVYWDIHFDNFIISHDFHLQAVIDLENVELAPLDSPLFVIYKMTDEPAKYLSVEDEKFANKKDYAQLIDNYRTYYPEMFAFENLEIRVAVYQLLDTLRLLKDWSHENDLHTRLDTLIKTLI